jgi:hypothetical protein
MKKGGIGDEDQKNTGACDHSDIARFPGQHGHFRAG